MLIKKTPMKPNNLLDFHSRLNFHKDFSFFLITWYFVSVNGTSCCKGKKPFGV